MGNCSYETFLLASVEEQPTSVGAVGLVGPVVMPKANSFKASMPVRACHFNSSLSSWVDLCTSYYY